MKKYILIVAAIFLPLLATAQSKELKDQFKEYTNNGYYKKEKNVIVVQEVIKGLSGGKDQLYAKAKAFLDGQFKNVNSEIYEDDATAGLYELSSYYRGLSQWKHEGTINTEINAYVIVRLEVKTTSVRITIESDAWNVRMGKGRTKKELEGEIVKYAPITGKKLVDNAKQTEAFINLINAMYDTIDKAKLALSSNKATSKKQSTARTSAASSRVSSNADALEAETPVRAGATSRTNNATSRAASSSRATSTPSSARSTSRTAPKAQQQDEEVNYEEAETTSRASRSSSLRTGGTSKSYTSPRNRSTGATNSSAASYDRTKSSRPTSTATNNSYSDDSDDFE